MSCPHQESQQEEERCLAIKFQSSRVFQLPFLSGPDESSTGHHGIVGRITGSASIETLVRVGIEKEHGLSPDSKMVVLHDFTPCVDDELTVERGQVVNILYRENDWVYVIGQDSRQEGFIPFSYCAPFTYNSEDMAVKKKLPRDQQIGIVGPADTHQNAGEAKCQSLLPEMLLTAAAGGDASGCLEDVVGLQASHSQASLSSDHEYLPFAKDPSGRYIVLYTFIARDENDVSVERGEFVTVLNREDPDWFWILRSDGQEGFIPSGFVYPADNMLQSGNVQKTAGLVPTPGHGGPAVATNSLVNSSNSNNNTQVVEPGTTGGGGGQIAAEDLRYHGTELVMLYDYKAQAPDDLSVRRGDWIYSDLNHQTVDGWLWSYSPKTRKYGFIPKAYARPPAMTSL